MSWTCRNSSPENGAMPPVKRSFGTIAEGLESLQLDALSFSKAIDPFKKEARGSCNYLNAP